jgi:cytochrome c peroxidase
MEWCLDCHRNTEKALRPLDKVYDMAWQPPSNQAELGKQFHAERNIRSTTELTSCSTCHR